MKVFECKTVIVGAGVSGVTAAVNLLENGYSDFLLLEASERVGGRCHTIDIGIYLHIN
jgi:monoamine oxidase